ncbi:ankyrin repeat domain-containing protein [Sphingomonas changnyeongensis]|uniref:Ankyrin repeat domain-containing protein n=1 Tax=Sphingomonas changnyeongensis TaxID=2698679 RepID=A0A7Z2S7W6_9SPHN|nr:ankyrin repeat domain-containing protein [Sphingomonas changnyeongensis]QHL90057.1 ankyrin repeat domain-containing protein [Sphingomonas changnyeongensis]
MNAARLIPAVAALIIAAPAVAQFSDSYNFLKAVRDRDGGKAQELLGNNPSTLIDTRDVSTGERAVHIVTRARDSSWLAFLLQKGANPNAKDGRGQTPLSIAASIGYTEGAELLILRGAQVDLPNGQGETPLILAVQRRDIAMTRLLLTEGANPAKRDTATGMSARQYAERDGRSQVILKLMDDIKPKTKKPAAGPM